MARTRTTKKLAQRIDLNYFKRPTPYKRARFWLCVVAPLLALGWLVHKGVARDSRVYSSGRMSNAHAVLEKECAACHIQKAGEFSSKAVDGACQACHDGPLHHENQLASAVPQCSACHTEHRGRINISAASNQACAECHGDLRAASSGTNISPHIKTLGDGHPEVTALRNGGKDPSTILLNHSVHMKPIRRGPNGPMVQMECGDCHRGEAASAAWPYSEAKYAATAVSYKKEDLFTVSAVHPLQPRRASTGRERMAPVKYATACAACHLLTFDKKIDEGAPHDKPEVVQAFVVKKLQEYIAAHPADLRVMRDPNRDIAEKPIEPEVRNLTPAQWVAERTADADKLLWRKTCKQCHALQFVSGEALPRVAAAQVTEHWLPHAKFDHDAHRGFSCAGCHAAALTSTSSADLLVPGIANCKTCHAPAPDHAESRCFECHTYHDWSKRKDVKPMFTIPALRTGGK